MLSIDAATEELKAGNTYRLVDCFKIDLRTGTPLRLTLHDTELNLLGASEPFVSKSLVERSAITTKIQLRETSCDLTGHYGDPEYVSEAMVRGGLLNGATVTRYVVDWEYPFAGNIRTQKFFVVGCSYTESKWTAKLTGYSHKLNQYVGDQFTAECRYKLGEVRGLIGCGVDVPSLELPVSPVTISVNTVTGTESSFSGGDLDLDPRLAFTLNMDEPTATQKLQMSDGQLRFVSGANEGVTIDIKTFRHEGSSLGYVRLYTRTPIQVTPGDLIELIPGCNGTSDSCYNLYNNLENFGGFNTMPTAEELQRLQQTDGAPFEAS